MKPLIHLNKMSDITTAEQKKLCRHTTQCKRFVMISYTRGPVLTMCEKEVKQYIEEIAQVMGFIRPKFIEGVRPWEPEEIDILKEHYKEHKGKYGYAKLLAAKINRTSRQIADKAKHLKRKGEL